LFEKNCNFEILIQLKMVTMFYIYFQGARQRINDGQSSV
jgi:hypothetical protein